MMHLAAFISYGSESVTFSPIYEGIISFCSTESVDVAGLNVFKADACRCLP